MHGCQRTEINAPTSPPTFRKVSLSETAKHKVLRSPKDAAILSSQAKRSTPSQRVDTSLKISCLIQGRQALRSISTPSLYAYSLRPERQTMHAGVRSLVFGRVAPTQTPGSQVTRSAWKIKLLGRQKAACQQRYKQNVIRK